MRKHYSTQAVKISLLFFIFYFKYLYLTKFSLSCKLGTRNHLLILLTHTYKVRFKVLFLPYSKTIVFGYNSFGSHPRYISYKNDLLHHETLYMPLLFII